MMRKAPLAVSSMGKVAALDFIAQQTPPGPNAGAAAFNAAMIRQITAPQGADAALWREVAQRFRQAASLLSAPALRADAESRAKAADQLAAALK
jgi:hypothetical protein